MLSSASERLESHVTHYQNNAPPTLRPVDDRAPDNQQQPVMRLREEPPTVNQPAGRTSRKRKSPPANPTEPVHSPTAAVPPGTPIHALPPPHTLIQPHPGAPPPPHMGSLYSYPPPDYSAGGMPPHQGMHPGQMSAADAEAAKSADAKGGRPLSQSKRAEQNRKAQRAFRERRDQHVKNLEARSQLLDTALASADEANRRWEECRAIVDQLRIENAQLRAEMANMHKALSEQYGSGMAPNGKEANGNGEGAASEERDKD